MNADDIKAMYSMTDILDMYGLKANRNGFLQCPFHQGDREASLKIYKRDFNCFGCGANGDIFTFVMLMDGLNFREAFLRLGGAYGRDFPSSIKVYHAKKRREMQEKERKRKEEAKKENNKRIESLRKQLSEEEPMTSGWADCYNALQLEMYRHDVICGIEGGEWNP